MVPESGDPGCQICLHIYKYIHIVISLLGDLRDQQANETSTVALGLKIKSHLVLRQSQPNLIEG